MLPLRTLLPALILYIGAALPAQLQPPPSSEHTLRVDSGWSDNGGAGDVVVFDHVVRIQNATWLRLHFDQTHLPSGSRLHLTSLDDSAVQRLDAAALVNYGSSSCFLNGEAVRVQLIAGPRSRANRVLLVGVTAGVVDLTDSLCTAADRRVQSFDKRQGRLSVGCTGWLIGKDVMLTAGHCMTATNQILSFNVPNSSSTGAVRQSHPDDQYPVIGSSVKSLDAGVGADWAVGLVGPNANSGKLPGVAQGSWYDLGPVPASTTGQSIRITGYGSTSPRDFLYLVQKTHVGPLVALSGTGLHYRTDTTGGNSGSPIIHENTGKAIGIHTHGGCAASSASSYNSGTRIDRPDLGAAIDALTRTPGRSTPYGAGCGGSTGVPALSTTVPEVGKSIGVAVLNLPASRPGLLVFGVASSNLDLGPLGMPGCRQLATLDVLLSLASSGSGIAVWIAQLPNTPSLVGTVLHIQHAASDPPANPAGTVVSNGVKLQVGG